MQFSFERSRADSETERTQDERSKPFRSLFMEDSSKKGGVSKVVQPFAPSESIQEEY